MPGPATPIRLSSAGLDLGQRVQYSTTVAASPSAATETVVCTLTVDGNLACSRGVLLLGFGAYTVGTDGVSVNLKLRQTGTSGTTLVATGVIARTAAALYSSSLIGFDPSPVLPGQVYVLTATVGSASAASTFSAAALVAVAV